MAQPVGVETMRNGWADSAASAASATLEARSTTRPSVNKRDFMILEPSILDTDANAVAVLVQARLRRGRTLGNVSDSDEHGTGVFRRSGPVAKLEDPLEVLEGEGFGERLFGSGEVTHPIASLEA